MPDPKLEHSETSSSPGRIGFQPVCNEDPWIHRSTRMHCRTCMYCVPKRPADINMVPKLGRCRRHAPTMSGFPVVFLDADFCGDHKLNEG